MQTATGLCIKHKKYTDLYKKIVDFPLDNTEVSVPFSVRLAIDNVWSLDYTHQVIIEYKRFLFLMIVAGHKVAPSDQVDQVWHQHMLYSHSYWEEFCTETVHKKLHHWPAEGNPEFHDWYGMTIESYIKFFGICPPDNIWIAPIVRLTNRTHFIRIDKEENWIFPKWNLVERINKAFEQISSAIRFKYKLLISNYFINFDRNK